MRNLVPPEAMPFRTDLVYTYDCGDFPGNMKRVAELIDRAGFPARQAIAKSKGRLRGIGFANPIEVAGGPVERPGKDMSRITAHPDGTFSLECGIMSAGQGLETAMTHIAAVKLGISPDRIALCAGRYRPLAHRTRQRRVELRGGWRLGGIRRGGPADRDGARAGRRHARSRGCRPGIQRRRVSRRRD